MPGLPRRGGKCTPCAWRHEHLLKMHVKGEDIMAHPSGISMWDQVADMWSVWTACFLPASFAAYTMLLPPPVFPPASSLKNQHSDPCGGAAARKVTRISGSNVIYIN